LDNLSPQVHGPDRERPSYLAPDVELVVGDVRDPDTVRRALRDVDAVYHFAAAVGVGQSMYEIAEYTSINNLGTAVLLEALIANPVRRLVVASSMSLYGEGLYRTPDGTPVVGVERSIEQLRAGRWELYDGTGRTLEPVATPETKAPALSSIYALGKYDQERMCLLAGRAYGFDAVALRFFNVFGTRQALSNPYTGVLAIFASRLLNGNRPAIFEDGLQRRDFVHVFDVARACRLALESPSANGEVLNIGSGNAYTIAEIAERIGAAIGRTELTAEITAQYRVGDIRHCFADIGKARRVLGYEPTTSLDAGLSELAAWLDGQQAVDRVAEASAELAKRGLTVAGAPTATVAAPFVPVVHVAEAAPPVLITGGAGFVGSNVANRYLADGRRVIVFDNLSRRGVDRNIDWLKRKHGDRLELVVGDVRDAAAVHAAVARAGQIFHFAAQVAVTSSLDDPRFDFCVNAGGTLNVLDAIRTRADASSRAAPTLLFTSTNKVYGDLEDVQLARDGQRYAPAAAELRARGVSEDRPLDFHSPYGCSKGTADQYVLDYARSFGLRNVVFRMSCIYGPRQFGTEDQGWIAHFLIRALQDDTITLYGDGMQVRDALFIDDLVDAMVLATRHIDHTSGHAYNIGGGVERTTSLLELLESIERLTGKPVDVEWSGWRTGDQRYYVSDTRRFQRATGWSPRVSIADGLRRLTDWLVEASVVGRAARPAAERTPDAAAAARARSKRRAPAAAVPMLGGDETGLAGGASA
jgi:dTDP-L-rhamnose 4-epimerase